MTAISRKAVMLSTRMSSIAPEAIMVAFEENARDLARVGGN